MPVATGATTNENARLAPAAPRTQLKLRPYSPRPTVARAGGARPYEPSHPRLRQNDDPYFRSNDKWGWARRGSRERPLWWGSWVACGPIAMIDMISMIDMEVRR